MIGLACRIGAHVSIARCLPQRGLLQNIPAQSVEAKFVAPCHDSHAKPVEAAFCRGGIVFASAVGPR
eukprot:9069637-Alexandrium_andersonii.AAC.1